MMSCIRRLLEFLDFTTRVGISDVRQVAPCFAVVPNKKSPSRLARGFCVSLKPNVASIDVVRVISQVAAVGAVAQGVEHVGVDAVLDVMLRAVREDRVHACRM